MGDHCAMCAPTVETGREGWPVLVKLNHNVYGYSKTPGSSMTVLMESMVESGRWLAWPVGGGPVLPVSFASAREGAYAIGARLPDEPTTASALADLKAAVGGALDGVSIKETFGAQEDGRDAEIARLRADFDEVEKQRAYWQKQCEEARLVANNRTASPTLTNALALLDIAAEKNPPLTHIAALIRLGL